MGGKEILPWLGWLIAIPAIGGAFWYFSPEQQSLRACDDQLMAKLASPSSYRRVHAFVSSTYGGNVVHVEYEAQNPYGVPTRQFDSCTLAD